MSGLLSDSTASGVASVPGGAKLRYALEFETNQFRLCRPRLRRPRSPGADSRSAGLILTLTNFTPIHEGRCQAGRRGKLPWSSHESHSRYRRLWFCGQQFRPPPYVLQSSQGWLQIVNLDALTYAGNPENLADLKGNPRYRFVKGDITQESRRRGRFEGGRVGRPFRRRKSCRP